MSGVVKAEHSLRIEGRMKGGASESACVIVDEAALILPTNVLGVLVAVDLDSVANAGVAPFGVALAFFVGVVVSPPASCRFRFPGVARSSASTPSKKVTNFAYTFAGTGAVPVLTGGRRKRTLDRLHTISAQA